jgi:DNA-directed RNA polymerase subunit N
MIPIACWSCGKRVAKYWIQYERALSEGIPAKEILDAFGMTRYCCRRMFISVSPDEVLETPQSRLNYLKQIEKKKDNEIQIQDLPLFMRS